MHECITCGTKVNYVCNCFLPDKVVSILEIFTTEVPWTMSDTGSGGSVCSEVMLEVTSARLFSVGLNVLSTATVDADIVLRVPVLSNTPMLVDRGAAIRLLILSSENVMAIIEADTVSVIGVGAE